MLIDWQDQLHFERTASPTISRSDLTSTTALPADHIVRARRPRLASSATGCTQGAHIGLEKSIPAQAWHGRRLLQRCHHLAGLEPPVAAASAPALTWSALA